MDRIKELEGQVKDLLRDNARFQIEAAQATKAAERATIESRIRVAAVLSGRVRDEASVEDLVYRAVSSGEWRVDSAGNLIRQRDGVDVRGVDGTPMTPTAWVRSQEKAASHLFRDEEQGAETAGRNPWSREHWSLTEQGKVALRSVDEAQRMAQAAGSRFGATRPPE